MIGDHVDNQRGRAGKVTRIYKSRHAQEFIDVRWDDGGISLLSAAAAAFKLLSRNLESGGQI
jgi:hypothetical protein